MLGDHRTVSRPGPGSRSDPSQLKSQELEDTFASSSRPIRVAILCLASLFRESLARVVQADAGLRLWNPEVDGQPDVVLWVAESGAALRALHQEARGQPATIDFRCRAVLLDTAGRLGSIVAGLHGFLGYLPPQTNVDRLLICLKRVAVGQPDAPRHDLASLIHTLAVPPLAYLDRQILDLLALGCSQREIKAALSISERTHQRRITHLLRLLNGRDSDHLGAIAVALGFGWPWPLEQPGNVRPGSSVAEQDSL